MFEAKDNDFVEIADGITSDLLDSMKTSKQYDASTFFDGMPDDATCWAEVKYYSTFNFYLCIVRMIDNYDDFDDNEYE